MVNSYGMFVMDLWGFLIGKVALILLVCGVWGEKPDENCLHFPLLWVNV